MIKIETKYSFLFCMLTCVFLMSGCGGKSRQHALQLYITQLKVAAANKDVTNKATDWKLPKPVTYNAGGNAAASANREANNKKTTYPLQTYSIKQLQFVGTLTEGNSMSAYIMTPDSMIYLARVGDIIGENYGKIVKIDSDHIEISEKYVANGNQSAERIVTMELKD